MIPTISVLIILMLISCNSLQPDQARLSESFVSPSFSIAFYGSFGSLKYDSITVHWSTLEPKDKDGRVIYPKAVNTMMDCHGNQKTIVAGNSSYPSPFRVDDCPNNEYIFKLTNATGDSMVYRIPFDFDGSFYAQKFDFINGGIYKRHKDQFGSGVCEYPFISTNYDRHSYGYATVNHFYNNVEFNILPIDSVGKLLNVEKNQLNDIIYLVQGCRDNAYKDSQNTSYFISYGYYYTF